MINQVVKQIELFKEEKPSVETYWRSIILFGRNVASYKFAFGKALLELARTKRTEFTLDMIAKPYTTHLCEHLKQSPKQITVKGSTFLEACRQYNEGIIEEDVLMDLTVRKGFENVIDAFHCVNQSDIPIKFYDTSGRGVKRKIIFTDALSILQELPNEINFLHEIEARWNLVETAWGLGVSRKLLTIEYDDKHQLFVANNKFCRKDVTSARAALNGYQKGKCFYCFRDISIDSASDELCDVDHYFPHSLMYTSQLLGSTLKGFNLLDGVWNLVLACPTCNRGEHGKFAKLPKRKYLKRLHKRNEFFIGSHHPLKETLVKQTGLQEKDRINFLDCLDRESESILVHRWETENIGEEVF